MFLARRGGGRKGAGKTCWTLSCAPYASVIALERFAIRTMVGGWEKDCSIAGHEIPSTCNSQFCVFTQKRINAKTYLREVPGSTPGSSNASRCEDLDTTRGIVSRFGRVQPRDGILTARPRRKQSSTGRAPASQLFFALPAPAHAPAHPPDAFPGRFEAIRARQAHFNEHLGIFCTVSMLLEALEDRRLPR